MRLLIVCYSMSGNVASVAEKIAEISGGTVLRIEPEKEYPSKGMKKFLWGGKSALMGEEPPLKPYELRPGDYDHIVIGYPVWASTFPPPIRTFLKKHREELRGKTISAFACYAGSGAEKSIKKLEEFLETDSLQETLLLQDAYPKKPETVTGRDGKIEAFAEKLRG